MALSFYQYFLSLAKEVSSDVTIMGVWDKVLIYGISSRPLDSLKNFYNILLDVKCYIKLFTIAKSFCGKTKLRIRDIYYKKFIAIRNM